MPLLGRLRSISRSNWRSLPIRLLRSWAFVKRCTQAGRVTALVCHTSPSGVSSLSVKCPHHLRGGAHPAEEGGHVIDGRPLDLGRTGGHGRVLAHDRPVLGEVGPAGG